jgi:D-aspartate ligase
MKGDKPGAIVIGGHFQGLGIVRSLAKQSIPVYILDNQLCIGRFSRYTSKCIKCPDVNEETAFFDFLTNLVKKEHLNGWVVFPTDDETVYFLSRFKKKLQGFYRITTPDWEVVKYTYNKKLTYQFAEKVGIPIPQTFYPETIDDVYKLKIQYPLIIKPAVVKKFFNITKKKVYRADNEKELLSFYQRMCSIIDPSEIMIQEFIPGRPNYLFSFCPLFKNGKVLARIVAKRARQHPMDFGNASTYAEIVDIPELEEMGTKFLEGIDYYGLSEVEFKQDPRDGQYKLLEINARIWGWHTLAIRAGIDLPYWLYLDMIGEKFETNSHPREARWIRLITDIPTVISEIVKGRMKITDYLKSLSGKKEFAVFSLSDPFPFIVEFILLPYFWRKRGF